MTRIALARADQHEPFLPYTLLISWLLGFFIFVLPYSTPHFPMRVLRCVRLLGLLSGACLAAPASPTSTATAPQSTACGTIVNSLGTYPIERLSFPFHVSNCSLDTYIFNASLAYECLTSVPFNPAVATRFLDYYNDTLQFQSTLTYLKNPPASYQQPGVDLLGGLAQLQQGINSGLFPNQYEFEAALQTLLYAAHDYHLDLVAGILSAFSFASPYDIVSVSLDGVQLPKVYLAGNVPARSSISQLLTQQQMISSKAHIFPLTNHQL